MLEENDYYLNLLYLSGLFKQWHWSFRHASYEQLNKYTEENVKYYQTYQEAIKDIPWYCLKFADESHFKSKGKIMDLPVLKFHRSATNQSSFAKK